MAKKTKNRKGLSRIEREKYILKSAFDVFSTYGYRGSTTKMLADAAGINEVTLFRNFKSKKNLFKKVIEHYTFLARFEELEP
ncbi:MAG: TetR/AcrR family transcriptional regulator, partial [Candidatus Schekmanbacteria bacterium]